MEMVPVYFTDGQYSTVIVRPETSCQDIVNMAVKHKRCHGLHDIRHLLFLVLDPHEPQVICPFLTWSDFKDIYNIETVQLYLRIRIFPFSIAIFHENYTGAFTYLYSQVKNDCLRGITDLKAAVQIGTIDAMYVNFENIKNLKKRSFVNQLYQTKMHYPPIVFQKLKPKELREQIHLLYKEYVHLERSSLSYEYVMLMANTCHFLQTVFHCSLVSGLNIPILLLIDQEKKISIYMTENQHDQSKSSENKISTNNVIKLAITGSCTRLANFDDISGVSVRALGTATTTSFSVDEDHVKASGKKEQSYGYLVDVVLRTSADPIRLRCARADTADSVGHVIRAYCAASRLTVGNAEHGHAVNSQDVLCHNMWLTVLNPTSRAALSTLDNNHVVNNENDYSVIPPSPLGNGKLSVDSDDTFTIEKSQIEILRFLGEGQFSRVHCGSMMKDGKELKVAVKSRKSEDNEPNEKFLEEAYLLAHFDHPHIVRLLGVCREDPLWIVMEYAPLGELRSYLLAHGSQLSNTTLLLFSFQLCKALAYVEELRFVHRDVAARNVLLSSPECCKLADFGLSRNLDDSVYYKAHSGKMPIKWMAPESYNFKRFTSRSDVWMFAVCVWEIFSEGAKPWADVGNAEAIRRIEVHAQRLEIPGRAPLQLKCLLEQCWSYQPERRPSFREMKPQLHDMVKASRSVNKAASTPLPELPKDKVKEAVPPVGVNESPFRQKLQIYDNGKALQHGLSTPALHHGLRKNEKSNLWKGGSAALELAALFDPDGSENLEILEHQLRLQQEQSAADERWLLETESRLPIKVMSPRLNHRASFGVSTSLGNMSMVGGSPSKLLLQRCVPTGNNSNHNNYNDANGFLGLEEHSALASPKFNDQDESRFQSDFSVLDLSFDDSDHSYGSKELAYQATLETVKVVKTMTQELEHHHFVDRSIIIERVGTPLRHLFLAANACLNRNLSSGNFSLADSARRELSQAQQTLMHDLQRCAKAAEAFARHRNTALRDYYLRQLLQPLHSLAVDCKVLYQTSTVASR